MATSSASERESNVPVSEPGTSTGSEPAVPSLLDRLCAPLGWEMTRMRAIRANPAAEASPHRKKRPSCSADPNMNVVIVNKKSTHQALIL